MYVPQVNKMDDLNEILDFMKRFSFASIITNIDQIPVATHLPFIIESKQEKIIITSHFAKANKQWQHVASNNNLIIFTEPHAYISPQNYLNEQNVPTWNYISIHAYGKAEIIKEEEAVFDILKSTINFYEKDYLSQWDNLPQDYKTNLIKGIVAFRIEIDKIEGKKKLSQNRKEIEKTNIINSLSQSKSGADQLIAEYMKNESAST